MAGEGKNDNFQGIIGETRLMKDDKGKKCAAVPPLPVPPRPSPSLPVFTRRRRWSGGADTTRFLRRGSRTAQAVPAAAQWLSDIARARRCPTRRESESVERWLQIISLTDI